MHDDLKEAALLLAALSWAGLAVLLVGVGPLRLRGVLDRAAVFLVAATLTRLAFTHVQHPLADHGLRARRLGGRGGPGSAQPASAARPCAGRRAWAASWLAPSSTREFVHHVVERWL